MRTKLTLFTLALLLVSGTTKACSCFGPQSFCGVLNSDQEWWLPDAVVLGVKLGDYQHGMDVKIVQSFSGELAPDSVIRVWGDCGNLCRHYPETWNVGDTVVWSLKLTDLAGNGLCPGGSEYEVIGDYMISICGVYYLDYSNGLVSGPITTEGALEETNIEEFGALVNGCLSTGIEDRATKDPIIVRQGPDGTWLSLNGNGSALVTITDAAGRVCLVEQWNGSPIGLNELPSGAYLITVLNKEERWVRKVGLP